MIQALFGPHHLTFEGDIATWIAAIATVGLLMVAVFALQQLSEIKRDRDVQIMVAMGRRWEAAEMTEALQNSRDYTPAGLAALVEAARSGPKGEKVRRAYEEFERLAREDRAAEARGEPVRPTDTT